MTNAYTLISVQTMKMVRRDLEAYFDLRTGVLDKRVHKKAIGRMVEKYYMDALRSGESEEEDSDDSTVVMQEL